MAGAMVHGDAERFITPELKAFEDKEVVLSYTESMRIDENNKIINNSCRD
jgi:hypothetical protein